jgi:manganese transport protein
MNQKNRSPLSSRISKILLSVGPGFFCIGYTIGTGSVTAMIKAGSLYGMQLLWVLVISVFFSWILMEAYGRFAAVTGLTAVYGFKKFLKRGKFLAVIVIIGVVAGQWSCLSGILGLTSSAIFETLKIFIPSLAGREYGMILGIAITLVLVLYSLLLVGKYSFFEKILVIFVSIMGGSFLLSMFIVLPETSEIATGLLPSIPVGGHLMVAAFVGTTMAAPTFMVRPLLVKEKGWGAGHLRDQSRDAAVSAVLMFIISASIMAAATGALFHEGRSVTQVLDMVYALEPVAGKFAVALFMVGAMSAGLSSVFPIIMVLPLLVGDYKEGRMDTTSRTFKILTAAACLIGLTVPVIGANPIAAQVATQVANVFVLPLVVFGIILLINKKALMGSHAAGWKLNGGLVSAFIFSVAVSYAGIVGMLNLIG